MTYFADSSHCPVCGIEIRPDLRLWDHYQNPRCTIIGVERVLAAEGFLAPNRVAGSMGMSDLFHLVGLPYRFGPGHTVEVTYRRRVAKKAIPQDEVYAEGARWSLAIFWPAWAFATAQRLNVPGVKWLELAKALERVRDDERLRGAATTLFQTIDIEQERGQTAALLGLRVSWPADAPPEVLREHHGGGPLHGYMSELTERRLRQALESRNLRGKPFSQREVYDAIYEEIQRENVRWEPHGD